MAKGKKKGKKSKVKKAKRRSLEARLQNTVAHKQPAK